MVYSRSIEEHWDHLRRALEKLRQAKLYGRLHKCEFLKDKVDYLGFEVSADGVNASPGKVKAILGLASSSNRARYSFLLGIGFVLPQVHSGIFVDRKTANRPYSGEDVLVLGRC